MPAPLWQDAVDALRREGRPITTEALNTTMQSMAANPALRPSYASSITDPGISAAIGLGAPPSSFYDDYGANSPTMQHFGHQTGGFGTVTPLNMDMVRRANELAGSERIVDQNVPREQIRTKELGLVNQGTTPGTGENLVERQIHQRYPGIELTYGDSRRTSETVPVTPRKVPVIKNKPQARIVGANTAAAPAVARTGGASGSWDAPVVSTSTLPTVAASTGTTSTEGESDSSFWLKTILGLLGAAGLAGAGGSLLGRYSPSVGGRPPGAPSGLTSPAVSGTAMEPAGLSGEIIPPGQRLISAIGGKQKQNQPKRPFINTRLGNQARGRK